MTAHRLSAREERSAPKAAEPGAWLGGSSLPVVVLIGRPNVGKSSLFNRLLGKRKAIVNALPGVTRDRNEGLALWEGKAYRLVDTGGLEALASLDPERLDDRVRKQAENALKPASQVVAVLDGKAGVNPWDRDLVDWLRRLKKPVTFAVNKIDLPSHHSRVAPFYELGFSQVFPVSAETGLGLAELMDSVTRDFPLSPLPREEEELKIAVVGRPNVGKSSFVNRILGSERAIVDAKPGTTRDSLDTSFLWRGAPCLLVDTAGIRRQGRVDRGVEKVSVLQAMRSIDRSDIVLVLMDGVEGPTEQDAKVAGYAYGQGKGVLVLINKSDLITSQERRREILKELRFRCRFLGPVPVHFVSAKNGEGVDRVYEIVQEVAKEHSRWISTGPLNRAIQDAVKKREPSGRGGGRIKVFYGTQTTARPPTFLVFVNNAAQLRGSYERYLANEIRSRFGLERIPIRILFQNRRS